MNRINTILNFDVEYDPVRIYSQLSIMGQGSLEITEKLLKEMRNLRWSVVQVRGEGDWV